MLIEPSSFIIELFISLINFIGILLGLLVYFSDRKNKINKSFLWTTIFLLSWIDFAYFSDLSDGRSLSFLFLKLAMGNVFIFLVAMFIFTTYFLEGKKYPIIKNIIFLIGVMFYFITIFTNLVVTKIEPKTWGNAPVFGDWAIVYFIAIFFLTLLIGINLLERYFKLPRDRRSQAQYFLIGILIFILISFICNVVLSSYWSIFPFYIIGDFSALLFLGFTAYAIIKKELFNIRIILTTVLVALIAILLAVDVFIFTPDLLLKLYKLLILVVFIYFGYTLIRSVLREIEWRERVDKAYEIEKKAREGLQQLDEAKNQFIMASQHHLRSPLTAMRGYVDLIITGSYGKVPEKLKDPILKFQISTSRLIRIVNEFLDISQFQLGKKVVIVKPGVEAEPIMREIVEELQYEAQVKKLYLTFEKSTENIPLIVADREKLKVALANIIDNAIKYTSSGGITIKTQITGKKLQIIIKDTGIGLTEEERGALFSKLFQRGVEARKVFATGRGIGLFITNKIIEAHNGRIWVESEGKGKGSEFHIELPIG